MDNGLQMYFLGGYQREAGSQVKAHLVAEYAQGSGSGAVFFAGAFI